jgi:hypothetical protein
MRVVKYWAAWAACSVAACAGNEKPAVNASAAASDDVQSQVARYLPLKDGWQWAYDVQDEGGNRGMFVTRAHRLGASRFSLGTASSGHVVLSRSDGIVREETQAYVLKAPLAPGKTWPGNNGAVVSVSAVDRVVEVPAGRFVGCVTTVEQLGTDQSPERRVSTTYCPDVGITELLVEAGQSPRQQREHAVLRSFGQPIDLGAKPTP